MLILGKQTQVHLEASVAVDVVVAGFTTDGVVTSVARELVSTLAAFDGVVAFAAINDHPYEAIIFHGHGGGIDYIVAGVVEAGAA